MTDTTQTAVEAVDARAIRIWDEGEGAGYYAPEWHELSARKQDALRIQSLRELRYEAALAQPSQGDAELREAAETVHGAMVWAAQQGGEPAGWQDGNSFAEDKARDAAREIAARLSAPAPSDEAFAGIEEWEHDDQRELSLLYNHRPDDSPQFNRIQMRQAIRHGKALAQPSQGDAELLREVADAANDMISALNDTVTPITAEKYNTAGRRLQEARDRIDARLSAPAPSDEGWLIRQLEAWPERIDPGKTTSIEYLMKAAAAELRALASKDQSNER